MSVKLTFVVISLLILISFSLAQSNADTEQGVLFSEITNIVQDEVELVRPDQKTVVVQLTIEIWSTYDKTVTLEFDEVYPGSRTYHCGIRFVSSPDSSYNFNYGQQESSYHNCLYLGSFSVEPGIGERIKRISALAFTSDKNFSNELSTLEFAYTQYANNSEILIDQTYNATLIGPDFSSFLDTPPLDWGETRNPTNQDQIQMRIKTVSLINEFFEPSLTKFNFGIEVKLVNSYTTVKTVTSPCTHLIDAYIMANTSFGYFQSNFPTFCATMIGSHDIQPGITPLNLEMELHINGTHVSLPDGTYDFNVDAKMDSYGMSWNIVDNIIEIVKEPNPEDELTSNKESTEEMSKEDKLTNISLNDETPKNTTTFSGLSPFSPILIFTAMISITLWKSRKRLDDQFEYQ